MFPDDEQYLKQNHLHHFLPTHHRRRRRHYLPHRRHRRRNHRSHTYLPVLHPLLPLLPLLRIEHHHQERYFQNIDCDLYYFWIFYHYLTNIDFDSYYFWIFCHFGDCGNCCLRCLPLLLPHFRVHRKMIVYDGVVLFLVLPFQNKLVIFYMLLLTFLVLFHRIHSVVLQKIQIYPF